MRKYTGPEIEFVRTAVNACFQGCGKAYDCNDGRVCVELPNSYDVSFAELEKLSETLGTKLIDFRYSESDPGYSEYTPGHSEDLFVYVRL